MSDQGKEQNDPLSDAAFALGESFLLQGMYDKAQIIFEGLAALYPGQKACALAYAEALLLDQQSLKALDHFLFINAKFKDEGQALLGAARALILLERSVEAKPHLERVMDERVGSSFQERALARSILTFIS